MVDVIEVCNWFICNVRLFEQLKHIYQVCYHSRLTWTVWICFRWRPNVQSFTRASFVSLCQQRLQCLEWKHDYIIRDKIDVTSRVELFWLYEEHNTKWHMHNTQLMTLYTTKKYGIEGSFNTLLNDKFQGPRSNRL